MKTKKTQKIQKISINAAWQHIENRTICFWFSTYKSPSPKKLGREKLTLVGLIAGIVPENETAGCYQIEKFVAKFKKEKSHKIKGNSQKFILKNLKVVGQHSPNNTSEHNLKTILSKTKEVKEKSSWKNLWKKSEKILWEWNDKNLWDREEILTLNFNPDQDALRGLEHRDQLYLTRKPKQKTQIQPDQNPDLLLLPIFEKLGFTHAPLLKTSLELTPKMKRAKNGSKKILTLKK